ncbi:MAG: ribonuclease P protein component [Desulfuromonas sp.]|nr:MAG: ribonuclease P protein component [Desulfuromonas sp.]
MSCPFPKSVRLLKREDFLRTWRQGRKKHTHNFLVVISNRDDDSVRLGITASRKTGNAVIRNRIKRMVREYFRNHRSLFVRGADISIIAKQSAARLDYASVSSELGGLFHDEGLLS